LPFFSHAMCIFSPPQCLRFAMLWTPPSRKRFFWIQGQRFESTSLGLTWKRENSGRSFGFNVVPPPVPICQACCVYVRSVTRSALRTSFSRLFFSCRERCTPRPRFFSAIFLTKLGSSFGVGASLVQSFSYFHN